MAATKNEQKHDLAQIIENFETMPQNWGIWRQSLFFGTRKKLYQGIATQLDQHRTALSNKIQTTCFNDTEKNYVALKNANFLLNSDSITGKLTFASDICFLAAAGFTASAYALKGNASVNPELLFPGLIALGLFLVIKIGAESIFSAIHPGQDEKAVLETAKAAVAALAK